MDPAVKSSILWGIVGALSFLVALQGYQLVRGEFVGLGVIVGVTGLVAMASAVVTHLVRPRLARRVGNERT